MEWTGIRDAEAAGRINPNLEVHCSELAVCSHKWGGGSFFSRPRTKLSDHNTDITIPFA